MRFERYGVAGAILPRMQQVPSGARRKEKNMAGFVKMVMAAASLAIVLPGAATAQDASAKKKLRDPNQMVCKTEETLGSRLQSRKVCRTRAQWEEQRQVDRQTVERSQINPCQRQGGC